MAVLAGTGPGLAASGVGKEVRDALTLHPSGFTLFTVGHAVGCLHALAVFMPPHPSHTAHFRWCLHQAIGTTDNRLHGVPILPGLQWGLITRVSC